MCIRDRLWGDVSLFAEPRTSLASYSLKTNEKEEGRYVAKKFTDNLYSINIGTVSYTHLDVYKRQA